jgi:hypothetical protein
VSLFRVHARELGHQQREVSSYRPRVDPSLLQFYWTKVSLPKPHARPACAVQGGCKRWTLIQARMSCTSCFFSSQLGALGAGASAFSNNGASRNMGRRGNVAAQVCNQQLRKRCSGPQQSKPEYICRHCFTCQTLKRSALQNSPAQASKVFEKTTVKCKRRLGAFRPSPIRASSSERDDVLSKPAEAPKSLNAQKASEEPQNSPPTSPTEFIRWGGNLPSRRRLLYSGLTVLAVTLGGNLGGATSGLLGLNPDAARQLKLDTLFPVKGFKRCIESGQGFGEFHAPFYLLYPWCFPGTQELVP